MRRIWVGVLGLSAFAIAPGCGDDFQPSEGVDASTGGDAAVGGGSGGVGGTGASGGGAATGGSIAGGGGATGGVSGGGTGGTITDGGDAGIQCTDAADCGDAGTMVCDPVTATCIAPECTDTTPCGTNERCVFQDPVETIGVCRPKCQVAGPACANGATCVEYLGGSGPDGTCVPAGTTKAGQTCTSSAISTGCEKGLVCAGLVATPTCVPTCDYWTPTLPCVNGACYLGACLESGDGANVDAECLLNIENVNCGVATTAAGQVWSGVCMKFSGSYPFCHQFCLVNQGGSCPSGETCLTIADEIGICG